MTCNSTILCSFVVIHKIILLHDCEVCYCAWYWIIEVCHILIFILNDKKAHKNSLWHLIQRKSKILFKILQVCGSLLCLLHLWSLSVLTKLLLHWLWLNRQLFFWDMTLRHWVRCNMCFKGTQWLDKASRGPKRWTSPTLKIKAPLKIPL